MALTTVKITDSDGVEYNVLGDLISGQFFPIYKTALGAEGNNDGIISSSNPLPVSGGLTDAELRATPVAVSGTVSTSGLTDAELRATPVAVSGTVSTSGLTDAELRATPVAVSGTVSTSGLTDAELRNTPVAISTDGSTLNIALPVGSLRSAFGRLRVTNLYNLFDCKFISDEVSLLWSQEVGGTGGTAHNQANSNVVLTTAAASDFAIRQTRIRFDYQPGNSRFVILVGTLPHEVNVTKRIGTFYADTTTPFETNRDGLYFESDGTTLYVVLANDGTYNAVAQTNWNLDKLDGTGSSGVTLDMTKMQVFVIKYDWNAGTVKFGLVIDNELIFCHREFFANVSDVPFSSTTNLPVRWEIRQTGAGSGSMQQVSAAVLSDGAMQSTGVFYCEDSGTTPITFAAAGTAYPLVIIRLKSTHMNRVVIAHQIDLLNTNNKNLRWELAINPTIVGSPSYTSLGNSSGVEIAKGDGVLTISSPGHVSGRGFSSNQIRVDDESVRQTTRLGAAIDGTRDILVLSVTPIGNTNADVVGSLTWREIF